MYMYIEQKYRTYTQQNIGWSKISEMKIVKVCYRAADSIENKSLIFAVKLTTDVKCTQASECCSMRDAVRYSESSTASKHEMHLQIHTA